VTWYISVLSGIIQGLTEFLPVSSSGHLVVLHNFFGMETSRLEFDILLHVGTLVSIVFVFYRDIIEILTSNLKTLGLLIIATLPAVIFVFLFNQHIETAFGGVKYVGAGLLVTALFLTIASLYDKFTKNKRQTRFGAGNAFLIGISQALAVFPGISRSGLTISTALKKQKLPKSTDPYCVVNHTT